MFFLSLHILCLPTNMCVDKPVGPNPTKNLHAPRKIMHEKIPDIFGWIICHSENKRHINCIIPCVKSHFSFSFSFDLAHCHHLLGGNADCKQLNGTLGCS
ncbi:hypothetical protein CHARACLAT_025484 [Characodon lateralis]|uniref:Secreted protein n=1 Tax=Characodon lateralis TaxID=208331 RepID=A0ABU7DJR6_9TELE|nr:hypothetical protein [Characodon lateralis]